MTDGAARGATFYSKKHTLKEVTQGADAFLSIRPEDIQVLPVGEGGMAENALPGKIEALLFVGDRYEARLMLPDGSSILLHLSRTGGWKEEQPVQLALPAERTHVWPA